MSLWKVKFDCIHAAGKKTKTVKRVFLIEAGGADEVALVGRRHAEATATFGPKWLAFEFREAASVLLPMELT